jgi:hypothetical protein
MGKQRQLLGGDMENFKNVVYKCIEGFVPNKILRKNSEPEYYNKEIKLLKSKV